jgi:hypothetical protein
MQQADAQRHAGARHLVDGGELARILLWLSLDAGFTQFVRVHAWILQIRPPTAQP